MRLARNTTLVLVLSTLVIPVPLATAQEAPTGPTSLFRGNDTGTVQALTEVGQRRLETLKQEATTQSIRLVRMVDNLSQQRSLVIQMQNRALAPEIHSIFDRPRSTEDETEASGDETRTLFIQRDRIRAIEETSYSWMGTVKANRRDRSILGEVPKYRTKMQ